MMKKVNYDNINILDTIENECIKNFLNTKPDKKNIYKEIESFVKNSIQYKGYIDEWYFNEICKFIKFYVVAKPRKTENGKMNIIESAKAMFDISKIDGYTYGILEDWILEDEEFKNSYRKLCRNLEGLNTDNTIRKLAKIEISKLENYKGAKLDIANINELKSFNKMWNKDTIEAEYAGKVYKKIKNNHIDKMINRNFEDLYEYFNQEILNMNEEYKNIYFYELEKKLAYYLRNCTLKNINKIDNKKDKIKYIIYTVIYIHTMPVLTIRDDLSDKLLKVFKSSENYCMKQFESEVASIYQLIHKTLEYLNNNNYKNEFSCEELDEFEKIYNINDNGSKEFENKYKIKKDFNKCDVEFYNKIIKLINDNYLKKSVEKIKSKSKK